MIELMLIDSLVKLSLYKSRVVYPLMNISQDLNILG